MGNMWSLEFWKDEEKEDSPLRKEIEKISDKRTIKTMLRLFKLLEEFGPMLPMPNNKFLGNGVFELRDRGLGRRYYLSFSLLQWETKDRNKGILRRPKKDFLNSAWETFTTRNAQS